MTEEKPTLHQILAPRNLPYMFSVMMCRLIYGKNCPHMGSLGTFTERWITRGW